MAKKSSPLFRKSMNGYNKEDVNNYIISLNRTLEESRRSNEKALAEFNIRAEAADVHISEIERELSEARETISLLEECKVELDAAKKALAEKDEAIADLTATIEELRAKIAEYESESDDEKEKAEQYDSLCSKAGEILVIASSTAEDILHRANAEAVKIVGEAHSRKDLMLRTLSESVDAAADDINSYIKSAVDRCVVKINESVREVTEMANAASGTPAPQKKPKTVYIHNVETQ